MNYWKSSFLATLGDSAIDTMIERFAATPSPMSGLLREHFHGAATRVGLTETAFPHRSVGDNFLTVGEWLDASATAANVAWAREIYAPMTPHFATGRYVNYLNADEVTDAGAVPDNVFHLNQNITPAP